MHYREEEIEEELLEEDHDSGILGELQTEADSYSSGSDSGNFSRVFFLFLFSKPKLIIIFRLWINHI